MKKVIIRQHDFGDAGIVLQMHGILYSKELNFDMRAESHVAKDLSRLNNDTRSNLWMATIDNKVVGTIGIIERENNKAQLHWFLLYPEYRGHGIGKKLLVTVIDWCKEQKFSEIFLSTANSQLAARKLYKEYGFNLLQSDTIHEFGTDWTCEKWQIKL